MPRLVAGKVHHMTPPKLSELSEQDKIRLAAELDGWSLSCNERTLLQWHLYKDGVTKVYLGDTTYQGEFTWRDAIPHLPRYSASYDAVIPLIQKQDWKIHNAVEMYILGHFDQYFSATPSQLLDVLLVATGKATV